MTLRGNVQDFPLRAVLEMLGQTKKTGELQLRVADRVGALGLAGGRVVTAVFAEEEPLLALGARTARVRRPGGVEEDVAIEALRVGDVVLVRPGETIARKWKRRRRPSASVSRSCAP